MYIHTVKAGETPGEIARLYDTTEERIKENNLICGEICEGREILILSPTRTHVCKPGDTASAIAKRYGVKYDDLMMSNPSLILNPIKIGMELAVKYGTPPFGATALIGYCYRGIGREKLKVALPFLTYLTVSAYKIGERGVLRIFNDKEILRTAKERGKCTLMRVYDGAGGEKYGDTEYRRTLAKNITDITAALGYCGTVLSCRGFKTNPKPLIMFIDELYQRMNGCGLKLFLEIDEEATDELYRLSDGVIFIYDKAYLSDTPSFKDGEAAVLKKLSEKAESSKIFIDLPSVGFDERMHVLNEEAIFAYGKSCTITPNAVTLISDWRTPVAKGKFTPLSNARARLDLVHGLRLGGVSIDVGSITRERLMLIYALFSIIHLT